VARRNAGKSKAARLNDNGRLQFPPSLWRAGDATALIQVMAGRQAKRPDNLSHKGEEDADANAAETHL